MRGMFHRAGRFLGAHFRWVLLILVVLLAVRAVLPHYVKRYANDRLDRIPGYHGKIRDVELCLWRGAYQIKGLEIVKDNGKVPVPFFSTPVMDLSMEWGALFHGALVCKVIVDDAQINFVAGPSEASSQMSIDKSWTDRVKELVPFTINRFEVRDSALHYRDFHRDPKVDVWLRHFHMMARNITNTQHEKRDLYAHVDIKAQPMEQGMFKTHIDVDPFAKSATFESDLEVKDVDLRELNDLFKAYGNFEVEKGTFETYAEMNASDGHFKGYIKPLFHDMTIAQKDPNPLVRLWEVLVSWATSLLKNSDTKQVATKIPLEGDFDKPAPDVWAAVVNLLKNAFVKALMPGFDHSADGGGDQAKKKS